MEAGLRLLPLFQPLLGGRRNNTPWLRGLAWNLFRICVRSSLVQQAAGFSHATGQVFAPGGGERRVLLACLLIPQGGRVL